MQNKEKLKTCLNISLVIAIVLNLMIALVTVYEYKVYTLELNQKVEAIFANLVNEYPEIEKNDFIKILNEKQSNTKNIFKSYGIDLEKDAILLENNTNMKYFIILNCVLVGIGCFIIFAVFLNYNRKKDIELEEITRYLEELNKKNYQLQIEDNTEDELSILKNEIYKVTVMLKEQAEIAKMDKLKMKDSLSDISHQLKTPMTSILIMLDNIIENPNMENSLKEEFMRDIKRKVCHINFLVQELLKLSKFDANIIDLMQEKVIISNLLERAKENISVLSDLKNIKINVTGDQEAQFVCDEKWEIEALTNILKNAVEHSETGQSVDITIENAKLYLKVIIKDYGTGMDEEDLRHIFERFYKGKNASKDSIGIGLALAKSIIEKDNGQILIESNKGQGTEFIINYFFK